MYQLPKIIWNKIDNFVEEVFEVVLSAEGMVGMVQLNPFQP